MAGALTRLRAAHPGVEVSFTEAEPEGSLPLLREGELDLVLGFTYAAVGARDPRDFTAVPLLRDPAHAVLPAEHPLAAGDGPIPLDALAGETWIAGCERCRGHLMHEAEVAGFEPRIAFATDDHLTVQSLIAAGLGVSLLPALALCSARRDDVAVRPVAGEPARTVEVVMPAADRRPPAVTAMLAALRAAADELATTPEAAALGFASSSN
jgi:DNA-binding transcriptional LysR family regulator